MLRSEVVKNRATHAIRAFLSLVPRHTRASLSFYAVYVHVVQ